VVHLEKTEEVRDENDPLLASEKSPRKGASQNMVIYPSKGKVLWMSAFSLPCILAGIGIIYLDSLLRQPILGNILFGIFFIFPGLLNLLSLFPIVLQAFASSPILIINDEGIQAFIGHRSKLVKWGEISTIDLRKVGAGALFEVTLSPEGRQSFLSRQSALSRSRRPRRQRSRVISIPQRILPLSGKQLIEQIQQRYQKPIDHYQIHIRL
jgi:hypothetical protein